MKLAFYAPMKSPLSPTPSGDRLIARLLIKALSSADIEVELMSQFRSYNGDGNPARQLRLQSIGTKLADRIIRRLMKLSPSQRPDIWFTYHLFHKAPDWIGPLVAKSLSIPYVVAEASFAPKQANGKWQSGHNSVRQTLADSSLVIGLNSQDAPCVVPCLTDPSRYHFLPPFIDSAPFQQANANGNQHRRSIADELSIDADIPWLITVAMMRPGDKVESYELLANALTLIRHRDWKLLIVGSGPAEAQVKLMFSELSDKVCWLGKLEGEKLPALYAAADLFVWPAIKESPGMCFLEAQAAGTAVIGSNAGGVPDVVEHGKTGLLARHKDVADFANQVEMLLLDRQRCGSMGTAAALHVSANHQIDIAGKTMHKLLSGLIQ